MRLLAYYCSLFLVFVIPFENFAQFAGAGTLGRAAGLLAGGVWLVAAVVTGHFRKPHLFHIVALVFVGWNAVGMIWTRDSELTYDRIQTYAQLLVLSYMLWDLFDTRRALNAALQAYILGASATLIVAVQNYLSGVQSTYQRYSGAGFNADEFGLILALGIPIAWYLNHSPRPDVMAGMLRAINYVYLPAACFGIALSGTRTAIVASLPTVIYMVFEYAQLRRSLRLAIAVFVLCTGFALQPLIPAASIERLGTIGSELSGGDLNGRTRIWAEGIEAYLQQPLTGVGSGAYPVVVNVGLVAHNSYLSVLVETGMIGFVIYGTLLALVVAAAYRQASKQSSFWLTLIAIWALSALVLSLEHRKQSWLLLNLAICSSCVLIRTEVADPLVVTSDRRTTRT